MYVTFTKHSQKQFQPENLWCDQAPLGFADGPNKYRYAGNDPVNFRDPSGLSQAGHPLSNLAGGFAGNVVSSISNAFTNPGQTFFNAGQSLGQAFNSPIGSAVSAGISTLGTFSGLGGSVGTSTISSSSNPFAFQQSASNPNLFIGPTIPFAPPQTATQRFDAFANSLASEAITRARIDTIASVNPNLLREGANINFLSQAIALGPQDPRQVSDPLIDAVDNGFATLGNASRATGNFLGSGIEYVTSGYGGTAGDLLAGAGGFFGNLARTGGNIGAVVDLPRTISSTIDDFGQAIDVGQQHGFRVGVGQLVGTNQIAQYYVGNDFNGQAVDVNTLSNGMLRLSGTAGAGAGATRLFSPSNASVSSSARFGQLRDASAFLRDEAGITSRAYRRQVIESFGNDIRVENFSGQAFQYSGGAGSLSRYPVNQSRYLSPRILNDPIQGLALPSQFNSATLLQGFDVLPTRVLRGTVAPQQFPGGPLLQGGAEQIFIPNRSILRGGNFVPSR